MDKIIYDERNGLYYELGDDGMYYPALSVEVAEDDEDYHIGKYGLLRETYLKEHRPGTYNRLLMTGKLYEHLKEVDIMALEMLEDITEHLAKVNGCDEKLKARGQMEWVGRMNNYKKSAADVVLSEIIYN
ncbi:MAG: TnpV protein [Aminipila sp.]